MDDFLIILFIIAVGYAVLLFFDTFFKSCAHYPYMKLLEGLGLKIGFFTINWKTKAFNRLLLKWGNHRPRLLKIWFTFGVYASLIFLVLLVILLIYILLMKSSKGSEHSGISIEAVIPGVNLPLSELGYYTISLLVCSIIHELGHALAAVLEDVNLIEVGCNILFILPVAFVNISTEKFSTANYSKVLGILCAGVWHNIALSLLTFLLYTSLPYLFSPLYETGKGVTVVELTKNSSLRAHQRGLVYKDVIIQINDCDVYDENTWYNCLTSTNMQLHNPAFCIDSVLVLNYDESVRLRHFENNHVECCDTKNEKNLCFEYLDKANSILELPTHACLPGRMVIEKSLNFCSHEPHQCPDGLYCFKPILANNTSLFKIKCKHKVVIFIGKASDIYHTTRISPFVPKKGFYISTDLPDVFSKLLKYITVISLGLAFVNILPFMCMDGQYIAETLGNIFLKRRFGSAVTKLVISVITWLFTILFGGYLFVNTMKML